jgi:hypothetical protein
MGNSVSHGHADVKAAANGPGDGLRSPGTTPGIVVSTALLPAPDGDAWG